MKISFLIFTILIGTADALAAESECGLHGSLNARIKNCAAKDKHGHAYVSKFYVTKNGKTELFTAALDPVTGKIESTGTDSLWEAAGKQMTAIADLAATRQDEINACKTAEAQKVNEAMLKDSTRPMERDNTRVNLPPAVKNAK